MLILILRLDQSASCGLTLLPTQFNNCPRLVQSARAGPTLQFRLSSRPGEVVRMTIKLFKNFPTVGDAHIYYLRGRRYVSQGRATHAQRTWKKYPTICISCASKKYSLYFALAYILESQLIQNSQILASYFRRQTTFAHCSCQRGAYTTIGLIQMQWQQKDWKLSKTARYAAFWILINNLHKVRRNLHKVYIVNMVNKFNIQSSYLRHCSKMDV